MGWTEASVDVRTGLGRILIPIQPWLQTSLFEPMHALALVAHAGYNNAAPLMRFAIGYVPRDSLLAAHVRYARVDGL